MNRFVIASLAAAIGLTASPALAREVDRQEIAEVFADDVPQEQRLFCRDTRMFTLNDGAQYRACTDWRAQNRTRVISTYAALDGPESDVDDNLDIARGCFDVAIASQNNPYRKVFDEKLLITAARIVFAQCAVQNGMQRVDEYGLRTYDTGVWLGGR